MLANSIRENGIFNDIQNLLDPMDLSVVEVTKTENGPGVHLLIVVMSKLTEINTSDLAKIYNVVFPRYQVIFDKRDLSLEVTSPGLQRTFKDIYEFSLFLNRSARIYSATYSSYLTGIISKVTEKNVTFTDVIIEDKKEKLDELTLSYEEIQKAKLVFRWEDQNKWVI